MLLEGTSLLGVAHVCLTDELTEQDLAVGRTVCLHANDNFIFISRQQGIGLLDIWRQ